jgi:hypothetical protein
MSRFYPKGYIGSEQGILNVAKIRDPEHWLPEKILADEGLIWAGLGSSHSGTYLANYLGSPSTARQTARHFIA